MVGRVVKKDDGLNDVGVRLLPEGVVSRAEKAVQKRGYVVRERVGVEIVVRGGGIIRNRLTASKCSSARITWATFCW